MLGMGEVGEVGRVIDMLVWGSLVAGACCHHCWLLWLWLGDAGAGGHCGRQWWWGHCCPGGGLHHRHWMMLGGLVSSRVVVVNMSTLSLMMMLGLLWLFVSGGCMAVVCT